MDSTRHFVCIAIAVALFPPTFSKAQEFAQPQPAAVHPDPVPMAPQALPAASRSVAHLAFHVLELEDAKTAEALAVVKKYFPATAPDAAIFVDDITPDRLDSMIRELVDANIARVLSRPQMMTIVDQSAQIEVGQQIDGLPAKNGAKVNPRKVGLQMKCVPHIGPYANRMRLDIECTISKADPERSLIVDGKSYPAINEKQMTTTIEASSGQSVVLRGPADNMLITLTPTWVHPNPKTAVEQVGFVAPDKLRASVQPFAKIFDDIVTVSQAVESAPGATLINISIKNDKLELELALDEGSSVASLSESLAKLDHVKIDALNLKRPGTGSFIEIHGRIVTPERKPNTGAGEMTLLREEVKAVRDELRKLTETLQDRD